MSDMPAAGARIERVVRGVCAGAVRTGGAGGIVVLDDWTPEGELVYEWLVRELGETRVWRAASLAANVQGLNAAEAQQVGAWRKAATGALVAHPANRTALLLGGRLPRADLLPLGDVRAAQVESFTGRWSAAPEVEALAVALGGAAALDRAVDSLIEGWHDGIPRAAVPHAAVAEQIVQEQIVRLYERGRQSRMRPRVVPKIATRTIGIDLFD